jgi:hypothetical protein
LCSFHPKLEGKAVMAGQQARADRIARSLKRLGFRLVNVGRAFKIADSGGGTAVGSTQAMTLAEIEMWIAEHIKPGKR